MNTIISLLQETTLCGRNFSVYGTKEEPLFLAKQVAEIIEHTKASIMVDMVDEDEKLRETIFTSGQKREVWFLTENGLYEVLMQSRKPIAKEFKKGVKKILKEIRTQGGYIATQNEDTPELIMARALKVADKAIRDYKMRLQMLEGENEQYREHIKKIEPKAWYTESVLQADSTYTFTQMAKALNFRSVNVFIRELRSRRIIFRQSGQWQLTAEYSGRGYTKPRTALFFHSDGTSGSSTSTVWTEKGRLFLHEKLVKK